LFIPRDLGFVSLDRRRRGFDLRRQGRDFIDRLVELGFLLIQLRLVGARVDLE
jgi:hypothetical protein